MWAEANGCPLEAKRSGRAAPFHQNKQNIRGENMSEQNLVADGAIDVPVRSRSKLATVVGSSLVGTTIEFYDFFIYGTAAALVFPRVFFPTLSPYAGIMAAYATLAIPFLTRPLGAIVFGHFGDRFGRKATLVTSLAIMGLSTFAIGLVPS